MFKILKFNGNMIPPELISMAAQKAQAIPATALGIAQTVTGLINSKKTKREAARLAATRPKLEASPYLDDQLSLAQSELSSGMSGAAESAYEQGLSRDVSSSLDAILKGGGDVNNVAEIFDRSAVGRQRLSLMKENLRLSQINNLVNAQGAMETQRQQMFQFNDFAPWADASRANAQGRQKAQDMIWGGLQTVASGAMGSAQGAAAKSDFNNYFNPGQQGGGYNGNPQYSQVQQVPNYNGTVQSPGANMNYINPNYGSGVMDQYFQ
jgi:hypothetical protein